MPRFRRQHASGGHGPVMPGGAAPHDNPLIAGSQRDPLADRCCHGAPLGSPGILRYRRGPEQQESRSHVRAGTTRTIVLPVTLRPIRQVGKRGDSPGKVPAPASPGARPHVLWFAAAGAPRDGRWLRLTVRARSGVLAGSRRLDPRPGRGGPAVSARRCYPSVCAGWQADSGGGSLDGLKSPEMAVAHQPWPWSSGQPRRPASPPGHAGSAGSGGGLGCQGVDSRLVRAQAARTSSRSV